MRATLPEAFSSWRRTLPILLVLPLLILALGCRDNDSAITRGDRLWADSSLVAAVAEYRLAVAQRGDEEALARLAHALVVTGELQEARDAYRRLLELSPAHRDQAAYDLAHLARRAARRGDAYGAATAMGAALELRPELQMPRISAEAAAYYRDQGEVEAALRYYERTLAGTPADSAPPLLYEIGRLEQERGRCAAATDYFRAVREQARAGPQWRSLASEAQWQTGRCAFDLAEEARDAERSSEALAHLDTLIQLGVPKNLLDRAWFERGELLLSTGEYDQALSAYRQVLELNPARRGQLVERAQRRIDEIRFGEFSSDGVLSRPQIGG